MPVVTISPTAAHLHGATLAQDHFEFVLPELKRAEQENTLFFLDCSNAKSVTASFLKGTLYRAFLCGQADVQSTPDENGSEIRPLKLFPMVVGCNDEVRDSVHEFFKGRKIPIAELPDGYNTKPSKGQLLGSLDPLLGRTLHDLAAMDEATAGDMAKLSRDPISINGWNNRLADLLLLRLVTRRRQGKYWLYSSLLKEINLWD